MTRYNPLLIYGGTGLGKTHIVQAIGNYIVDQFPTRRVMYATSEKFTSDFIAAISDRTISDFSKMYRDVDLLEMKIKRSTSRYILEKSEMVRSRGSRQRR